MSSAAGGNRLPLVLGLIALPLLALALWGGSQLIGSAEPIEAAAAAAPERETPAEGTATSRVDPVADLDPAAEQPTRADATDASEEEAAAAPGEHAPTVLRVRLVDESAHPVEGAELTSLRWEETVESDANGVASMQFGEDQHSSWNGQAYPTRFRVRASACATQFLRVALPRGEVTDVGDLVLAPGGALVGRVVDGSGTPLADVQVVAGEPALGNAPDAARLLGPLEREDREEAVTDAAGAYRLSGLPAGQARLWAHREGAAWAFSDVLDVLAATDTPAPDLVIEALEPSQLIAGVVLDPAGAPIANALVVGHAWVNGPIRTTRASSDDRGRFELVAIGEMGHTVKAFDPDDELRPTYAAAVEPGTTDLELRLSPRQWMTITVVDDASGEPIEEPWVHLEEEQHVWWGIDEIPPPRKETLGPGVVRHVVPQETFLVSCSKRGWAHRRSDPIEPESAPAEFEMRLERQAMVRGVVLADGEPVEGAWVQLCQVMGDDFPMTVQGFRTRLFNGGGGDAVTDAEGRFELPARRSEFETAHAVLAGIEGWAATEVQLQVPAGGLDGLEVVLTPGGSIEGAVLLPGGRDPHGTLVAASRGDGRVLDARVDEQGRYRFDHLTPGPWYLVHREQAVETVMSVAQSPWDGPYSGDCEVVEGRTTEHDLDERGAKVEISGRLTFDGAPAAGWTVRLEAVEYHEEAQGTSVLLDHDGRFVLQAQGESRRVVLESPPGEVHHVLKREYVLSGESITAELDLTTGRIVGTAPEGSQVSAVREVEGWTFDARVKADGAGAFAIERVPVGPANLRRRVTSPGGWLNWEGGPAVDVAPGQAVEADF